MSKVDTVRAAMMQAMKDKDKQRKDALSLLLSALKAKQIDKRADLTEEEENAVIFHEIKQAQETIDTTPNGVNLTKSTENSIVKPNIRSGPHCSHCSIYKCYFRMISPIDREFISIT